MSTSTHTNSSGLANTRRQRIDPKKTMRSGWAAQTALDHQLALAHAVCVLDVFPNQIDALLLAGQSCLMLEQYADALDHLNRLVSIKPRHALALSNRGAVLEHLGRLDDALKDFSKARSIEPSFEDAWINEAQCLQRLGRHAEAANLWEELIKLSPSHEAARTGLVQAMRMQAQSADGLEILKRHAENHPSNGLAWRALGDALLDRSQWQEALDAYSKACQLLPDDPMVYSNSATALRELNEIDDALEVTEAALKLDADCLPALRNKVILFLKMNRWLLAIEACNEVIKRCPEDALTFSNLGTALHFLKQYPAALDAFQTATRHDPKMVVAWVNLSSILELLRCHEPALEACEKALELDPQYPNLLGRTGHARHWVCDWTHAQEDKERLLHALAEGHAPCDPFRIISFSDRAQDQQQLARRWLRELPKPHRPDEWPAIKAKAHSGRIRVGYFSADFHHHATTLLMAQMLELHDRSRFELVAISFGPSMEDSMRARVRASVDSFHDVVNQSDDQLAQFARSLNLDIAVDLKGYTLDHRIGLFQRRVAPVQISYLGFPGTLGAPFMDYILADHSVIPDELRCFYDEKVIRIAGTYQPNDRSRQPAQFTPPTRSSQGLPDESFVFCCFNNNYKITPEVFDIWMRLLSKTPESVLWLLSDNESAVRNLMKEAQARGVSPDRLVFAPRVSWKENLNRQVLADLFLDTLPCNAHTTASDALRVGLPVLTCTGTAFAARVAASLVRAQGLDELVTGDLAAYEELALALAHDPERMQGIRARAEAAIQTGALLDSESHVRRVERAYQAVIERAWQGKAPDHLDVN